MSNRRKTPAERQQSRIGKCQKCGCRDRSRKVFADGTTVAVCNRCGHCAQRGEL